MKTPTSTLPFDCDISEPARVPLVYDGAHAETPCGNYAEAIRLLKDAVNESLYTWETFPVHLPKSVLSLSANEDSSILDVFRDNEVEKCEASARKCYRDLNKLNKSQLRDVRTDARFITPCNTFTGEVHSWKISPCILKGTRNIYKDFNKGLYTALSVLVVTSVDFIENPNFSILRSLADLGTTFRALLDLFFGWPQVNSGDIDRKLLEERLRFLICDLSVKSNQKKKLLEFWNICEEISKLSFDTCEENAGDISLPYRFLTPTRISVDLRLHDPALLERCLQVVGELRNSVRGDWFQDVREFSISQYRDEKKSVSEIKRLVLQDGMKQYAARLFDAMRHSEALFQISPGIAEVLIQEASFKLILEEAKEIFLQNWLSYRQSFDQSLRLNNPILFNTPRWRARKWYRARQEYLQAHKFDIHEYTLSKCVLSGLEQHAFLIGRDLTFLKDRECLLRDKISKSASFPDEEFVFRIPLRCLRNVYVYREDFSLPNRYQLVDTILIGHGPEENLQKPNQVPEIIRHIKRYTNQNRTTELIPLMYRYQRSSFVMNMSKTDEEDTVQSVRHFSSPSTAVSNSDFPHTSGSPSHYHEPLLGTINAAEEVNYSRFKYVMQSALVLKASTRYFMWRWLVFFLCTYSWLIRSMQCFFIIIPFQSYFSYTVLFKETPIFYVFKVEKNSGYVYYDKKHYVHTITSFLNQMWSTMHKIRENFDHRNSSSGTLRRYVRRSVHWIWIFIIRGLLTSIIVITIWPILCILCSTASIIVGLIALPIIPLISLFVHILGILFWNAYTPVLGSNRYLPLFEIIFHQFLLKTVIQFIICTLCAFILCPLWFLVHLVYSLTKYVLCSLWDGFVFHIIFKLICHIPCKEICSIKRGNDPGTVSNICLLARPEDILIVLSVQLERLELNLWKSQMESIAKKPMNVYNDFLKSFATLPLSALSDNTIADSLNTKTRYWLSLVEESFVRRAKALGVHSNSNFFRRFKLSDRNLKLTLDSGSELTKCFYNSRILRRLHLLERCVTDWWANFQLGENDYMGLCNYLLRNAFGEQFFSCITEENIAIPLQVRDASLSQRFRELMLSNFENQICAVSIHSAPGNGGQSTNVETVDQLNGECCGLIELENEDESFSLNSDILGSRSEKLSQRCTVIAAPSKNNCSNSNNEILNSDCLATLQNLVSETSHDSNNIILPTMYNDIHSGGFEVSLMKPSVIDPVSLIHFDLPNFPLSAFAPRSIRCLPSSLKSYPKRKVSSSDQCTCAKKSMSCSCIALTKSSLESNFRKTLTETWSNQSFEVDTSESSTLLLPISKHNRHHSSSKPLLSIWSVFTSEFNNVYSNIGSVERVNDDNISSLLTVEYDENQWCYSDGWCLCSATDMSDVNDKCTLAFQNIVQHIARVFHPCIITLLMHSRDRENSILDMNHPSVHKFIRQITLPPGQMKLMKKVYAERNIVMSDLTSYADSSLHQSVGQYNCFHKYNSTDVNTISLDTVNNPLNELSPSFKQQKQKLSHQMLKFPILNDELVQCDSRSQHKWYSNINVNTSNPYISNQRLGSIMNHSLYFHPNRSQNTSYDVIFDVSQSQLHFNTINQMANTGIHTSGNLVAVTNSNLADTTTYQNSGCYWSGLEITTNKYNTNMDNRDYSGGTPTPSLYGTEDAATTDDLEESEDIISMSSSINHSELVDNLLSISAHEEIINDVKNTAIRPVNFPLAVPELLTISATSAGSNDTQSQLESEIIDDFSLNGLTPSRILNPGQLLSFPVDPTPSIQSGQSTSSDHSSHDIHKLSSGGYASSPTVNSRVFFDNSPAETLIINGAFSPSNSSSRIILPQDSDVQSTEEVDSTPEENLHRENGIQRGNDDVSRPEPVDQTKNFEMNNVSYEDCRW
uniref:Uncharacterized protein n=1 Tax=Trichobilharzia regenti TaxID=157069 RepID=A0AA85KLU6_TRIRE|nr:unnamed protein product [Trichobilharzia regenti]